MKFHEFMTALFNVIGADFKNNQEVFFKETINNLVVEEKHGFVDNLTKSSISKYMSGNYSFSKKAKIIMQNLEITNFINFLNTHLTNDDQINAISNKLNEKGAKINNFNPSEDIADFFVDILFSTRPKRRQSKNKSQELLPDFPKQSLAAAALSSNPQKFLERLNIEENEYKAADLALNSIIPEKIGKDFEYRIFRNSNGPLAPELIPTNENSFLNHQLSFKYSFKGKDELVKFIRSFQKADILRCFVEVNPNSVERYIDDFKDEYYDKNRYKQYIRPIDRERPVFTMRLSLDNGIFSQLFDNLILKEQEIKDDTLIYSNIDDDNWLFIKLSIDCSKFEEGVARQNLKLGIKKEYATNIDYYKNFHKCDILMKDNNTHITLTDITTNNKFMDIDLTNKTSFSDNDYKGMLELFNSYDKISKIQEKTGTIFTFNPDDFNKYKPTYDVAYACVMNKKENIKAEFVVEIVIPDKDLNNYKVGDKKERSIETDFMVLFDKKITFKSKTIKLKDAETLEVYKHDGLNIAKVKTYEVSIK